MNSKLHRLWPTAKIHTVDVESYYGANNNLKDLSYTEYVHHPEFELQMLGIDDEVYVGDEAQYAVKQFDWANTIMVSHNAMFDSLVLKKHLGVDARAYGCTMSMANVLIQHVPHDLNTLAAICGWPGPKKSDLGVVLESVRNVRLADMGQEQVKAMIAYCRNDVAICRYLYDMFVEMIPKMELELINQNNKMWLNPILELDVEKIDKAIKEDEEITEQLIANSGCEPQIDGKGKITPPRKVLSSGPKFAKELKRRDVVVPMKISPTTNKPTFAFAKNDIGFKDLYQIEGLAPLLDAKVAASSSIVASRGKRLKTHATICNGLVPVAYRHSSAHTGRIGGTDKSNMANLPRVIDGRPRPSDALRTSLLAPTGYLVVVADSSNIEARMLELFCGEPSVEKFRIPGYDPYADLASLILGRPITKGSDPEIRQEYKVVYLGSGYGLGPDTYRRNCAVGFLGNPPRIYTEQTAYDHIYGYRNEKPLVVKMWKRLDNAIQILVGNAPEETIGFVTIRKGEILLPSGRTLQYRNLKCTEDGDWVFPSFSANAEGEYSWSQKYIYGGRLLENIIQALCRDIVLWQMLEIEKKTASTVVMHTYDEVVGVVPYHLADETLQQYIDILSTPPDWCPELPLAAEGGYAQEYSK